MLTLVLISVMFIRLVSQRESSCKGKYSILDEFCTKLIPSPFQPSNGGPNHLQTSIDNRKPIVSSPRPHLSVAGNQSLYFDMIMNELHDSQSSIQKTNQVIIYHVNPESGLGNVIIGLVSCIFASLATNRGLQSTFVFQLFIFIYTSYSIRLHSSSALFSLFQ